ncbi:MAG: DUF4140 domain-containing protein [Rhodomicrobium sp.]|nr:DUF4140 domain-containing protein [Rhodomicrobium sp.]
MGAVNRPWRGDGRCASAAEIALTSRVDAVTVFPRGAEIARLAPLTAAAGSHVLILSDLPAELDENSIRVEGEASALLDISSVDARKILIKSQGAEGPLDDNERKRFEAEIRTLQDRRMALEGVVAAAEGKRRSRRI